MGASMALTAIFHHRLHSVFNPIITYLPLSLYKQNQAELEKKRLSAILKFTPVKRSNTSELEKNSRNSSIRSASEYLYSQTTRVIPTRHSRYFNNTLTESSRNSLYSFRSISVPSKAYTETYDESKTPVAENHIFNGIETSIKNLTKEQKKHIVESAFHHYSLREIQPCIWIPHDRFGISEDQINDIRLNYPHILISNEGCSLDEKGNISVFRVPPDFNPTLIMGL